MNMRARPSIVPLTYDKHAQLKHVALEKISSNNFTKELILARVEVLSHTNVPVDAELLRRINLL